jgi:hypothetical protein
MDKLAEIKKALQAFGLKPNLPMTAEVVSIENDTCTVKLNSNLVLTDIRLKATISQGSDYFLLEPKIGTDVIIMSQTGELSGLIVIKVDQIARFVYKQNGLEILVDSNDGKVSIKNDTSDFKTILVDLATLLKQLKVFTPVGPSGNPLPDSILAIEQFENKVKQLFK